MFNVKISLLFFLLVLLCVVSILTVVGGEKKTAIKQIESELATMPQTFRVHKELRESRLREFAQRVGASEVGAWLEVLSDYRLKFIEVDRYICSEETGVKCDLPNTKFSTERARIAEEQFGSTVFESFSKRAVETLKPFHPEWKDSGLAKAEATVRKVLKECFGRGSKQCDWRMLYEALCGAGEAADARTPGKDSVSQCGNGVIKRLSSQMGWMGTQARAPEVTLVFDGQGVGIANVQDAKWSDRRELQSLVDRMRQFVRQEGRTGITPTYYELLEWRQDEAADYLVALVPVISASGKFVGAIMVGESITAKMVEAEKDLFDYEMTYILGDKPLASTLSQADYKFMLASANVSQRLKKHRVSNSEYLAVSMPYFNYASRAPKGDTADTNTLPTFIGGVAYGPNYQRLRVVIATPRERRLSSFSKLQTLIPGFGLSIFLVGVILFFLLVRAHQTPFEKIDAGIHEINSGNFDYEFPYDYKDELPSSMAQSLNLMVAVLLGKPLPEDEESHTSSSDWGSAGQYSRPAQRSSKESGGVHIGDALGPDSRRPANDAAFSEPAEAYYRRIYNEYRSKLEELGVQNDSVTYVRFVEHIARSERELKSKFDVDTLRFVVKVQDSNVILSPIVSA